MNPQWRVELFGGLILCQEEERITRFATQKTAALLAYLAFYRHKSHPREVLIEFLWPECEPDVGRNRLSTLLAYLRRLLEPPGTQAGTVVQADRASVGLNPDVLTTDVAEFERLLQGVSRTEDVPKRLDLLERAVLLYKGDLLPGSYEEWVGREQTRLRERHAEALQELALAWEQTGDIETALATIERAIRADPYREAAHRTLMRLQAALGRPAAVQESYQSLERLFREELGASPSTVTRELAARLRNDPRAVVTVKEAAGSAAPPAAPIPTPPLTAQVSVPLPEPIPPAALPLQMSRFFGRSQELAQLQQICAEADTRLVTLTGPGGAGKTRLAIETAQRLAPSLHNRVWFVPLADLPDAHLLAYALARALKVSVTDAADPLEPVLALLNEAPCLLALDNFEHLIRDETPAAKGDQRGLDKGTALVRLLLERAPTLRCLVTSRRTLRLKDEQEFPLPPLPLPALASTPEEVLAAPSAALYVDRAKRARPDFALTVNNAHAVAHLCRRLEGMPLAIEMAAAWAKALPPAKMLERLEERLDALTSRQRDLPMRHQSLRATIDWSYDLLDAPQQRLLVSLSVFRGGWSLEAAEAICTDAPNQDNTAADRSEAGKGEGQEAEPPIPLDAGEILELLTSLVEKSLVVSEETEGDVRYRFLETVRQYSKERLTRSGEADCLQARHYRYFLEMAQAAWGKVKGSEQIACLNALEREHDNFRAALVWSGTPAGRQSCGLEAELTLAGRLSPFWEMRGYWREGRERLEAALAGDTTALPREARARALNGVGVLAERMGDTAAARVRYEECLAIWQQLGNQRGVGSVTMNLGRIATDAKDFAAAHRWYAESLEIAQELKHDWLTAANFTNLGLLAEAENDAEAQQRYEEAALSLWRRMGESHGIVLSQLSLSALFSRQRDFPTAYRALLESFTLLQELRDKRSLSDAFHQLAVAENRQGRTPQAVRLWGAVQRLIDEMGVDPGAEFPSVLEAARQEVGGEGFNSAFEQGRTMSTDAAVADALAILRAAF
jgi:predicted ATPase/DNA-binding SARP family transcriptional activator